MQHENQFGSEVGRLRTAFKDDRWNVAAPSELIHTVMQQLAIRRRRRNALMSVGSAVAAASVVFGGVLAIESLRGSNAEPLRVAADARPPSVSLSVIDSKTALPAAALEALSHSRFPAPYDGGLATPAGPGEEIYLVRTGNNGVCIVVLESGIGGTSVGCEEMTRVLTTGVYLVSGEGAVARTIVVVPDGYTTLSTPGREVQVRHNVAVLDGNAPQTVSLSGAGFTSTILDLSVRPASPYIQGTGQK
jgi:hypothetical protein